MRRRYGAVERNVSAVHRSPLSYESSARNAATATVQTKCSVTEKLRTAGVLCSKYKPGWRPQNQKANSFWTLY